MGTKKRTIVALMNHPSVSPLWQHWFCVAPRRPQWERMQEYQSRETQSRELLSWGQTEWLELWNLDGIAAEQITHTVTEGFADLFKHTHHAESHSSTSCCLSVCAAPLLKLFKLMRVKQRWRNPCLDASPVNRAAKSEELPWPGWSQCLKNSGVSQDKWARWAAVLGQ